MSDNSAVCDDDLSDGSTLDIYATTGSAVLEPGEGASGCRNRWSGPHCEKCEAPLTSGVVSICRRCGWYASLGAFLEVDPDWETDSEPAPASAPISQTSHVRVWINMLPRWAWIILASLLAVIVESIVARMATPADSALRTAWSLAQLAVGVIGAVVGHVVNFLALAADDAEIGLLDLLLKPVKLWARAVQNLPARLWVSNAAASGLVAAVMSLIVIGGIPYDRLWDWGFKEPPKKDLMGAIMDRMKKVDSGKGADDLEQAIGDFAGSQDADGKDKHKPEPPKPKSNADCVILGYLLDNNGRLATLLLGTANRGELVYAGTVTPKLSDNDLRQLGEMLHAIPSKRPIIKIESDATWVQPKYTCRVSFAQRTKSGHLHEIEWDKMLGSISKVSK
jgi:hypothetical protein